MVVGGPHAVTTLILSSAPCLPRSERRDDAYEERVRDKSDRVRERSRARTKETKNEESTPKKEEKERKEI